MVLALTTSSHAGKQSLVYMQSEEAEEQMGGYGKAEGKLDFAAGFSPGKASVREMGTRSGELSLAWRWGHLWGEC